MRPRDRVKFLEVQLDAVREDFNLVHDTVAMAGAMMDFTRSTT